MDPFGKNSAGSDIGIAFCDGKQAYKCLERKNTAANFCDATCSTCLACIVPLKDFK